MEDSFNEVDTIFNLRVMYKNRLDVEADEEKKQVLKEMVEHLDELLVLVDSYLTT